MVVHAPLLRPRGAPVIFLSLQEVCWLKDEVGFAHQYFNTRMITFNGSGFDQSTADAFNNALNAGSKMILTATDITIVRLMLAKARSYWLSGLPPRP
jgi:hypothetical protein